MKKVLITGACGFIGSHLVEYFVAKKIKVIAYDKYNFSADTGWLENNKNIRNTKIVLGDINDYSLTNKLIKEVDYVIHLAALISIPYSYFSPGSYVKTNVEGTYNILESARLNRKKVIITSTSEVYGTGIKFPMNENHPLFAQSPYAASKIAADNLTLSYYNTFNLPVKIIRPFNAFGPRQSNRAIIPTVISQILSNRKKIKVGNIYPKRDWTYVTDLCSAFYSLYKSPRGFGKIYNVGTGKYVVFLIY
jgi:dTDP-D-glucose 4,6-dehydratase